MFHEQILKSYSSQYNNFKRAGTYVDCGCLLHSFFSRGEQRFAIVLFGANDFSTLNNTGIIHQMLHLSIINTVAIIP